MNYGIHTQRVNSDDVLRIRLVRGQDYSGERAYYFIKLHSLKTSQFDRMIEDKKQFDLADFGEVLASGYGEEIPEYVMAKMRRDYGWH